MVFPDSEQTFLPEVNSVFLERNLEKDDPAIRAAILKFLDQQKECSALELETAIQKINQAWFPRYKLVLLDLLYWGQLDSPTPGRYTLEINKP